jgi:transcriptional regulator with XRE-family HTH domain
MKLERSQKLIITGESRALKALRLERGLSLRQVGVQVGMSHTYIAHVEAGRMATPAKPILMKILAAYGVSDYQVFYDKARNISERTSPKDQLLTLIHHLPDERIEMLLRLAKGLAEGKAMVMF